jgi:hypothetical protein
MACFMKLRVNAEFGGKVSPCGQAQPCEFNVYGGTLGQSDTTAGSGGLAAARQVLLHHTHGSAGSLQRVSASQADHAGAHNHYIVRLF